MSVSRLFLCLCLSIGLQESNGFDFRTFLPKSWVEGKDNRKDNRSSKGDGISRTNTRKATSASGRRNTGEAISRNTIGESMPSSSMLEKERRYATNEPASDELEETRESISSLAGGLSSVFDSTKLSLWVRDEMKFSWGEYRKSEAWKHDSLKPVSGQGDDWVGWAVQIPEALDTLLLMNLFDEAKDGLDFYCGNTQAFSNALLQKRGSKNNVDSTRSDAFEPGHYSTGSHPFFETTIRLLGGILGAKTIVEWKEVQNRVDSEQQPSNAESKEQLFAQTSYITNDLVDGVHEGKVVDAMLRTRMLQDSSTGESKQAFLQSAPIYRNCLRELAQIVGADLLQAFGNEHGRSDLIPANAVSLQDGRLSFWGGSNIAEAGSSQLEFRDLDFIARESRSPQPLNGFIGKMANTYGTNVKNYGTHAKTYSTNTNTNNSVENHILTSETVTSQYSQYGEPNSNSSPYGDAGQLLQASSVSSFVEGRDSSSGEKSEAAEKFASSLLDTTRKRNHIQQNWNRRNDFLSKSNSPPETDNKRSAPDDASSGLVGVTVMGRHSYNYFTDRAMNAMITAGLKKDFPARYLIPQDLHLNWDNTLSISGSQHVGACSDSYFEYLLKLWIQNYSGVGDADSNKARGTTNKGLDSNKQDVHSKHNSKQDGLDGVSTAHNQLVVDEMRSSSSLDESKTSFTNEDYRLVFIRAMRRLLLDLVRVSEDGRYGYIGQKPDASESYTESYLPELSCFLPGLLASAHHEMNVRSIKNGRKPLGDGWWQFLAPMLAKSCVSMYSNNWRTTGLALDANDKVCTFTANKKVKFSSGRHSNLPYEGYCSTTSRSSQWYSWAVNLGHSDGESATLQSSSSTRVAEGTGMVTHSANTELHEGPVTELDDAYFTSPYLEDYFDLSTPPNDVVPERENISPEEPISVRQVGNLRGIKFQPQGEKESNNSPTPSVMSKSSTLKNSDNPTLLRNADYHTTGKTKTRINYKRDFIAELCGIPTGNPHEQKQCEKIQSAPDRSAHEHPYSYLDYWSLHSMSRDTRFITRNADFKNILRPETLESLYYLRYFADGTPTDEDSYEGKLYQIYGAKIFNAMSQHSRVKWGFSATDAYNQYHDNNLESFFMAETMKYSYLLLAPKSILDLSKVVFNTEAHPVWRRGEFN